MAFQALATPWPMACAILSAHRGRLLALSLPALSPTDAVGRGVRRSNAEGSLAHEHVAELPRIALVDILREEARPPLERRPVGVNAGDRAEIGGLHFEAAAEVQFVSLDDPRVRIFQRAD